MTMAQITIAALRQFVGLVLNEGRSVTGAQARLLAAEFVRLHNLASKEYKDAFAAIGARMWNADDCHPLRAHNQTAIANEMMHLNAAAIRKVYVIRRPLTVLDSYPRARRHLHKLEPQIDEIQRRHARLWSRFLSSTLG